MDYPILLCVATEKGYNVLRAVKENGPKVPLHVCTFKEVKVVKRFYEKICTYADEHQLPIHSWIDIRKGGINWLKQNNIYAMVCVGWRYLVTTEIIEYLGGRILATHDSLLPRYRGFAPLASALINGEKEVGVTVMFVAAELDAGDIVYQGKAKVDSDDTIADLTQKVLPLFTEGVVESLHKMISGEVEKIPQDHSKATYSIWRDEEDLWIDWNDSAERIERTIRALGPPYMGARTRLKDKTVIIHSAEVISDLRFEIRQPGKVWSLTSQGKPHVVCGKGMLLIHRANIGNQSLIPMKNLRVRFSR
jgi:methionyl-tRNA formyltransferase